MKKSFILVFFVLLFAMSGCKKANDSEKIGKWDCSVTNASDDMTTINYSDVILKTDTKQLCFQNRNEFAIVLYIGTSDPHNSMNEPNEIKPGGQLILNDVKSEYQYNIGVHADVKEGTEIHVMVYDGDTPQEPYTLDE